MHFFLDYTLGLTRRGWSLLVALTVAISCGLYATMQVRLQAKMFDAVNSVDVLANFCAADPALADACAAKSYAEGDALRRLSDEAIWHLLREAQLIDTEIVDWPGALSNVAPGTPEHALHAFLSNYRRQGEKGIQLFAEAAEICAEGRPYDSDAKWHAMIARLLAGTGEATHVSYLGRFSSSTAPPAEFRPDQATWWRITVPPRVPDAEIVAALVGFAQGFGPVGPNDPAQGLSVENCTRLLESSDGTPSDEDLYLVALRRIELGLWVAGQIRRDDTVAEASADATLYTGPEQFGILTVFTFALLLAAVRLICLVTRHWRGGLLIGPASHGDVDPALARMQAADASEWSHWRAQLTQRIASARWPLPTAAVLLPALGFVGTVRGIKNSLAGADGLVFADTLNERADAIATLSGDLGLAFATTLLALLFSLILTILLAIEGRLIDILIIRLLDTVAMDRERP